MREGGRVGGGSVGKHWGGKAWGGTEERRVWGGTRMGGTIWGGTRKGRTMRGTMGEALKRRGCVEAVAGEGPYGEALGRGTGCWRELGETRALGSVRKDWVRGKTNDNKEEKGSGR